MSAETIHAVALGEIDTIYVDSEERYVVSLVVSCDPMGRHQAETPEDAARYALDMTRDDHAAGTTWHVYDRETRQMHVLRQKDFDPEFNSLVLVGGDSHGNSK